MLFDDMQKSLDKKKATIEKALAFFKKKEEEKAARAAETLTLDISEDMYCGSMSADVVSEYVCMLCYGIVQQPIQCKTCNTQVCKLCVNQGKLNSHRLECFKKCGSRQFNMCLSGIEQKIYNSLLFRCQNDECKERIPLGQYRAHLHSKCKVRTWKYIDLPKGACSQFDEYGGEVDDEEEDAEGDWEFDDPESEASKNPYYEMFLVGDLNKLYLEQDEELDTEIAAWNEQAHIDYL